MDDNIKTKRLTLRPLRISDAQAVAVAADNFNVSKWLARVPHPYSIDDAKTFINATKSEKHKPLGIFHDDRFIGVIGVDGLFGLGYWLAEPAWGQGFGAEAARAVVDRFFASPNNTLLRSAYIANNHGSAAIQRRLGFVVTKTNQIDSLHQGLVDYVETYLGRDDWLAGYNLPIQTHRLFLRPLTLDDTKDLQSIAGNDHVAPMLASVGSPWSETSVKAWINNSQFSGRVGFRLGVCLNGGRLIGMVGLGGEHQPSLAYFISKQFWGRGYASEAASGLLEYAFDRFQLEMVASDAFTDNPASQRVLEKLGFEHFGEEMANSAARLEPAPVFLYRLTKQKYESQRQ